METPVLFVLTPRAGRWNHRYLVPCEASWGRSEARLGHWAKRAAEQEDGADFVSVCREVSQAGNGRCGTERLVLHDARLESPARKRQIKHELESYLDEVQTLVTDGIDWNQTGQKLVVPRPELDRWQQAFEGLLSQPIAPSREQSSRPPDNCTEAPRPMPLTSARRIKLFPPSRALWCMAAILASGMLVVALWLFNGGQNGNTRPVDARIPRRALDDLAKAIGLPTTSLPDDLLLKQIADKLHGELFDWESPEPIASPDPQGTSEPQASEQRLKETLKALCKAAFESSECKSLKDLVEDQGLPLKLRALYPAPEYRFNSTGLLAEEVNRAADRELLADLQDFDPIRLRQIGQTLHDLQELLNDEEHLRSPKSKNYYDRFFCDVYKADQSIQPVLVGGPQPRFYLQGEFKTADALFDLLDSSSPLRSLVGKRAESAPWPQTFRERLAALKRFPLDELRKKRQREVPENNEESRAYQLLETFIENCCEAVDDAARRRSSNSRRIPEDD